MKAHDFNVELKCINFQRDIKANQWMIVINNNFLKQLTAEMHLFTE